MNKKYNKNKVFRFIEHTADVGVVVYGKSLTELFQNAAESFFSVLIELKNIHGEESRRFSIDAPGLEELLVSWLNEFLYLFETQGLLFSRFEIKNLSHEHLEATAWGEKYTAEKHSIKRVIKAVTFHQLSIQKQKGRWKTQIIFDL
jgi:SHS2 domain-containing protein